MSERARLALIASTFVVLVLAIAWHQHALLLPLWVGLLAWLKALLKVLTPKFALLLVKNGVFIKGRQLTTALLTRFLVVSHRPWRRRLLTLRGTVTGVVRRSVARFVASPLWFRAGVALGVLALTAGSAYAFVALLIIPRAVLDWLRLRIVALLNKLGMTRALDWLSRRLVPERWRRRWLLFAKWRLGRHQVQTSRRLHGPLGERLRAIRRPRPGRDGDGERGSGSVVPTRSSDCLADGIEASEAGAAWARGVDRDVAVVLARWPIVETHPLGNTGTGSWVAGCTLEDGTAAVLKVGFPHVEGRDEIDGLAFWDGEPSVRLLAADRARNAMLLERCVPGEPLSALPEPEQDEILVGLLRRLWRRPAEPHPFRHVAVLSDVWCAACRSALGERPQDPLVRAGLDTLATLSGPCDADVLLATDLHAGNVLRAERAPWLLIDPKPFVGDPALDLTQHLLNCPARLSAEPLALIARVAALASLDPARVRAWLFARLTVEPGRLDADGRRVARTIDPGRGGGPRAG